MSTYQNVYGGPYVSSGYSSTYEILNDKITSNDGINIKVNQSVIPVKAEDPTLLQRWLHAEDELSAGVKSGFKYSVDKVGNTPNPAIGVLNNTLGTIGKAGGTLTNIANDTVLTALDPANKMIMGVNSYLAPTLKSLEAFEAMGTEFDKAIEQTFLGQVFNVKGSELLCTFFCIVIGFLSCQERQNLYDAVQTIKADMTAAQATAQAMSNMVDTYTAAVTGLNTIAYSASSLMGTQKLSDLLSAPPKTTPNGMSALGGAATVIAVPKSVNCIVNNLRNISKVFSSSKITIPINKQSAIWYIASCVLYGMQCQAVSLADRTLQKVIQPIEDALIGMLPPICIGNMASITINKIIGGIKRFKQWILIQVAELFKANNSFVAQYLQIGMNCKSIMELNFLLQGLNVVLSHFTDFALSCGVSPCTSDREVQKVADCISAGREIPLTNVVPSGVYDTSTLPTKNPSNLDDIANRLAPVLKVPASNIIVGPNHTLQVIYPGYGNVPRQIRGFIQNGSLANELGPAYSLYMSPDGTNTHIVYTYGSTCGE